MDSAIRGQGGIQVLLMAEQEAQKIVSDARNCNYMLNLFITCHSLSSMISVENGS